MQSSFGPLIRRLPHEFSAEYCFDRLARIPGCVWLDSSLQGGALGRYSYMATDPFSRIRLDKSNPAALVQIAETCRRLYQPKLASLPPMQGGWMGWFGYEMGSCFERIPLAAFNEFSLPLGALGLYDVVLSWDHLRDEAWIVSQGWPYSDAAERQKHAYRRLLQFLAILEQGPRPKSETQAAGWNPNSNPTTLQRLAPQHATRWSSDWTSNFSSAQFRAAVRACVDYIHAGDVFQVNLSQRLLRRAMSDSRLLYSHLRQRNPTPFSGYADLGRVQVLSTSPERFLELSDSQIETRPIKGTRPRLSDPVADAGMGELLRTSKKDRAENVMIVDLLRNDLSRISEPDSLQVSSLCKLEQYSHVWHLVSVIRARLRAELSATDVIQATFPGGSITGAPKIRAMEIIAELEPTVRGPYCGSLGYISFAGDMDLNILIRTVTVCDGWWQVPVGGGIVADSRPDLEEQETWHKAEGILRAVDALNVGR